MRGPASGDEQIVSAFLDLYWNQRAPWARTCWRGHPVAKCPLDLWIYQEILFETQPDLLIETGSSIGGSAYFFASLFDIIGKGHVVTVDKDHYPNHPAHERISYFVGDSISPDIVSRIHECAKDKAAMVALDSLHSFEHVRAELEAYTPLVSPGYYLVVEDTAVDAAWGVPAAHHALSEFLQGHNDFVIDKDREKHLLTFNPDGWIRRTRKT